MAYEGAYASPVELGQTINEAQLGPEAPVCSVVNIAGDQQGIHLLLDAKVNYVLVGIEGSTAQGLGDMARSLTADAAEGTIKVQIGRVDEAESSHGYLILRMEITGFREPRLSRATGFYRCSPGNARLECQSLAVY
jgi:hypothetical protein